MTQNQDRRRGAARTMAIAIVAALLVGFAPMWIVGHSRANERDAAIRTLTRYRAADHLSAAALYARKGEYEKARQEASTFYTELGAGIDKGDAFSSDQKSRLRSLLTQRDELITLLARADPASVDRLFNLESAYRTAVGNPG